MHSKHTISVGHEFIEDIQRESHGAHTEHVISLLVNGQLTMDHGEIIDIKPGMVTLVPAGVPHSLIEGKNIDVWWLGFCTSCLGLDESQPLMAPFAQIRLGALPVFDLSKERQAHLIMLMSELNSELETSVPESFDVVKSLLLLVLNEVKKASGREQLHQGRSSIISKALEFIQKHSLESISLKDVANAIHISPAYLATSLKKGTGYSVGEWISRNRLTEACSRLRHTDEKIDAISRQVGWNDVTHFIRQFKKAYGETPAVWRKNNK